MNEQQRQKLNKILKKKKNEIVGSGLICAGKGRHCRTHPVIPFTRTGTKEAHALLLIAEALRTEVIEHVFET